VLRTNKDWPRWYDYIERALTSVNIWEYYNPDGTKQPPAEIIDPPELDGADAQASYNLEKWKMD
jgi:hypothetical protein